MGFLSTHNGILPPVPSAPANTLTGLPLETLTLQASDDWVTSGAAVSMSEADGEVSVTLPAGTARRFTDLLQDGPSWCRPLRDVGGVALTAGMPFPPVQVVLEWLQPPPSGVTIGLVWGIANADCSAFDAGGLLNTASAGAMHSISTDDGITTLGTISDLQRVRLSVHQNRGRVRVLQIDQKQREGELGQLRLTSNNTIAPQPTDPLHELVALDVAGTLDSDTNVRFRLRRVAVFRPGWGIPE